MNRGRRKSAAVVLATVLLVSPLPVFATWSVLAVDAEDGLMAIASATCVPTEGFVRHMRVSNLKEIQAIIVPGKGIAAAQASVDVSRRMQEMIRRELERDTDPGRILDALSAEDDRHLSRQYGIVDLQGRSAGHSGGRNGPVSLDRQGQVDGTRIYFSIQGNILASAAVVEDAERAFRSARGSLADRVMAAMEAADAAGGDRRCACDRPPDPPAPCETKTAHVAYLVVAGPDDPPGSSLNDGRYRLEIHATDRDIQPGENDNPVKTLQMRYDARVIR